MGYKRSRVRIAAPRPFLSSLGLAQCLQDSGDSTEAAVAFGAMVRIVIAAMLSALATGLFVAAFLTASITSAQTVSALGLVVIADLNLAATIVGESRRRVREAERGATSRRSRQDEPSDAGQEAIEQREAARLMSTLEVVAEHQESAIAGRPAVDVVLLATGKNKIAVIKELREYLGGGLAEAKDLADRAGHEPVLLASNMPVERARRFADALHNAGARALLR